YSLIPLYLFFAPIACPLPSPPFPYTTLFRSVPAERRGRQAGLATLYVRSNLSPEEDWPQADFTLPAMDIPAMGRLLTGAAAGQPDRKSTRLNSSHVSISYAVFCLKKTKLHKR